MHLRQLRCIDFLMASSFLTDLEGSQTSCTFAKETIYPSQLSCPTEQWKNFFGSFHLGSGSFAADAT